MVELYQHRAGAMKSTGAAEPKGGGDDNGQILLQNIFVSLLILGLSSTQTLMAILGPRCIVGPSREQ